jgi:DNA adenine methylase
VTKSIAIKWHGGKSYLAKEIIALMPPRAKNPNKPADDDPGWLHYVEPYFGGGAVLFAQDPEGISEVVNDIYYELSNFWACMQGRESFDEFSRRSQSIPFSKVEYEGAHAEPPVTFDKLGGMTALAVNFFIRCRQSMAGRMDSFAPLTLNRTRRGMNEQASAWLNAIEGLPAVHSRLRRVVVLNDEAVKVIRQQDGPRTLFYLDPPYVHDSRESPDAYDHEMTDQQHAMLLNTLSEIKGRFLLSGYPTRLYDQAEKDFGWRHVDFIIDNKTSSAKSKEKKIERLWMNYGASP